MSNAIRIESVIKEFLAPVLREDGFLGSGRTFRRICNQHIHVVNVQGSKYGGKFSLNLAIQPMAIPDVLGNSPNSKKIVESECEFRKRLSSANVDQWWNYDDLPSLQLAMKDAAQLYKTYGRDAFEKMSSDPSPLAELTPSQIGSWRRYFGGFGTTNARMALVMARLREAEGRIEDAASFARYGLENIGNVSGLKHELQRLAVLPNK